MVVLLTVLRLLHHNFMCIVAFLAWPHNKSLVWPHNVSLVCPFSKVQEGDDLDPICSFEAQHIKQLHNHIVECHISADEIPSITMYMPSSHHSSIRYPSTLRGSRVSDSAPNYPRARHARLITSNDRRLACCRAGRYGRCGCRTSEESSSGGHVQGILGDAAQCNENIISECTNQPNVSSSSNVDDSDATQLDSTGNRCSKKVCRQDEGAEQAQAWPSTCAGMESSTYNSDDSNKKSSTGNTGIATCRNDSSGENAQGVSSSRSHKSGTLHSDMQSEGDEGQYGPSDLHIVSSQYRRCGHGSLPTQALQCIGGRCQDGDCSTLGAGASDPKGYRYTFGTVGQEENALDGHSLSSGSVLAEKEHSDKQRPFWPETLEMTQGGSMNIIPNNTESDSNEVDYSAGDEHIGSYVKSVGKGYSKENEYVDCLSPLSESTQIASLETGSLEYGDCEKLDTGYIGNVKERSCEANKHIGSLSPSDSSSLSFAIGKGYSTENERADRCELCECGADNSKAVLSVSSNVGTISTGYSDGNEQADGVERSSGSDVWDTNAVADRNASASNSSMGQWLQSSIRYKQYVKDGIVANKPRSRIAEVTHPSFFSQTGKASIARSRKSKPK